MGVSPFRVLSVCTGGAGLDRGFHRAEPSARTVCYVEVEAFACAVLAAQMDAGALDAAPVWTDARTFDGRAWRGAVDCVVAGFPCQDISSAGKRAGIHGERSGLWFDVARIVRDVGARYVFLENVDALLVRGIDTVLGSLAEMGFAAQWGIFSAAETGAPHLRERWFCLAVAESESGGQRELRQPSGRGRQPDGSRQAVDDANTRRRGRSRNAVRPGRDRPGRTGSDVGDTERAERWQAPGAGAERDGHVAGWDEKTGGPWMASEPLGSPNGSRLAGGPRERSRRAIAEASAVLADTPSERPGEAGRLQPGQPLRAARSGCPLAHSHGEGCCGERSGGVLGWNECHADGRSRPSALMAEFPPDRADMRAWAEVQTGFEPAVCRLADGLDMGLRTDWLRLLGNGVVPQQAEHAYRTLRGRLMTEGLWREEIPADDVGGSDQC